jgi:hypothetical protein
MLCPVWYYTILDDISVIFNYTEHCQILPSGLYSHLELDSNAAGEVKVDVAGFAVRWKKVQARDCDGAVA